MTLQGLATTQKVQMTNLINCIGIYFCSLIFIHLLPKFETGHIRLPIYVYWGLKFDCNFVFLAENQNKLNPGNWTSKLILYACKQMKNILHANTQRQAHKVMWCFCCKSRCSITKVVFKSVNTLYSIWIWSQGFVEWIKYFIFITCC